MIWGDLVSGRSRLLGIINATFFIVHNIFLLPFVVLFKLLSPFYKFKIVTIDSQRIGHLASRTEVLLRKNKSSRNLHLIGITGHEIANYQLLKMYKRILPIFVLPQPLWNMAFFIFANPRSILVKFDILSNLVIDINEYDIFSDYKPVLSFTKEEEEKGRRLLKSMGIGKKDWFVCLHARDSKYLKKRFGHDLSYHDYRDWDIINSMKAAEFIASRGGYVIRMGAEVSKKLPKIRNKRIIDYASDFRNDFGDIYLCAKCKFFIGDGCGINQVAQIFNVPEVWVNVVPIVNPPWSERGIFIPRKFYSFEKKRLLSYPELIRIGLSDAWRTNDYTDKKIKIIENTSIEIYDLVREAYDRYKGLWKQDSEAEKLRLRYNSMFDKKSVCYGFRSSIGSTFLKKNKTLLE